MPNKVKMIPVEVILTGIETFKKCYEKDRMNITPAMFEAAINSLNMVEEFVKRTPHIEVDEVIPGKWLPGYPVYCSVCGGAAPTEYEDANRYEALLTTHCPHCGQPMEVENDRS